MKHRTSLPSYTINTMTYVILLITIELLISPCVIFKGHNKFERANIGLQRGVARNVKCETFKKLE